MPRFSSDAVDYTKPMTSRVQLKPTRTQSGVAPVAVLTKPFPCPGKCIFCPNDIRMPKSYLANEPGAQRAERNFFDPYLQTSMRLQALKNIGHSVEKVELIILGGTWSYYPEAYQIWFVEECFRALNDFGKGTTNAKAVRDKYIAAEQMLAAKRQNIVLSDEPKANEKQLHNQEIDGENLIKSYNQAVSELYVAPEKLVGFDVWQQANWNELAVTQKENETALCRNVGLVIETRPDNISPAEVLRIRRLGCTKTQIGVQSLSDEVLSKNHRGHDVAATRRAFALLRQAGFKIHAHWMLNLYGSSPEQDKKEFLQLFSDPDFCPDELKIYPCSLIASAELMQYYRDGRWRPYEEAELVDVLSFALSHTPEYCRLTRVIRDIPSTDIVVGNKKTNFRQIAEEELKNQQTASKDIRAREIRQKQVRREDLHLDSLEYPTAVSKEVFLQYITDERQIAGFLRLSLPKPSPNVSPKTAMIREVHVYGQVVSLGQKTAGKAQHLGLGTALIEEAKRLAKAARYDRLSVISAVGTREYYRARGFLDDGLYQTAQL